MKWKKFAIDLYFRLYGKRCVNCSHPVEFKDAVIEEKYDSLFLLHKKCVKKEKHGRKK